MYIDVAFLQLPPRIHVANMPNKDLLVLQNESSATKFMLTVRKLTLTMLMYPWWLHFQTASMDSDMNSSCNLATVVDNSLEIHTVTSG